MKIEYVNGTTNDILASLEIVKNSISDEEIAVVESCGNEQIFSINIEFNEGVLTSQTNDMRNIAPDIISKMTITLRK